MATKKSLLIGGGIAIGVFLIALLFFNNGLLFSIASQEIIYSQSGLFGGIQEPSLTSGSWSLTLLEPSFTCVSYDGTPADPASLNAYAQVRCTPTDDLNVILNGATYRLQKGNSSLLDGFTQVTYLGSSIASNNAQGIPTAWTNTFKVSINPNFLQATFVDEPATIAFGREFIGEIVVNNDYIPVQGNLVIQESGLLAFIKTTTTSSEQTFPLGKTTLTFPIATDELLGHHVVVIPSVQFTKGQDVLGGFNAQPQEHTYQVTPNGVSRAQINGRNVVVIPLRNKNVFQRFLDSIYLFFTRSST